MSGSVSGSQFNFLPRAVPAHADTDTGETPKPVTGSMYQQWKGLPEVDSLAPHAPGAFTSFDRQTAFRKQGADPIAHSATTVGSWLFKNG